MSKYYTWKKGGNKININTGFKSFDDYIVCISKGSCVGRGQTSFYIRPFNQKYLKKFIHSSATLPTYRYPLFFYS